MYGWRGRIGLIMASTNAVTEGEAHRMVPEGVSVHYTRISYRGEGDEADDVRLRTELETAAGLLAGSLEQFGSRCCWVDARKRLIRPKTRL